MIITDVIIPDCIISDVIIPDVVIPDAIIPDLIIPDVYGYECLYVNLYIFILGVSILLQCVHVKRQIQKVTNVF